MSEKIFRNIEILRELSSCSSYRRKKILQDLPADTLRALTEIAVNVLQGNLPLSSGQKTSLKRHKEKIQLLARVKGSFKKKKDFLVQKGGFLPHLLKPALQVLTTVAGTVIANSL